MHRIPFEDTTPFSTRSCHTCAAKRKVLGFDTTEYIITFRSPARLQPSSCCACRTPPVDASPRSACIGAFAPRHSGGNQPMPPKTLRLVQVAGTHRRLRERNLRDCPRRKESGEEARGDFAAAAHVGRRRSCLLLCHSYDTLTKSLMAVGVYALSACVITPPFVYLSIRGFPHLLVAFLTILRV